MTAKSRSRKKIESVEILRVACGDTALRKATLIRPEGVYS